ncbi:hypothetical protein ACLOJK_014145 [Asimina triloba]
MLARWIALSIHKDGIVKCHYSGGPQKDPRTIPPFSFVILFFCFALLCFLCSWDLGPPGQGPNTPVHHLMIWREDWPYSVDKRIYSSTTQANGLARGPQLLEEQPKGVFIVNQDKYEAIINNGADGRGVAIGSLLAGDSDLIVGEDQRETQLLAGDFDVVDRELARDSDLAGRDTGDKEDEDSSHDLDGRELASVEETRSHHRKPNLHAAVLIGGLETQTTRARVRKKGGQNGEGEGEGDESTGENNAGERDWGGGKRHERARDMSRAQEWVP